MGCIRNGVAAPRAQRNASDKLLQRLNPANKSHAISESLARVMKHFLRIAGSLRLPRRAEGDL
jgi:hypothetical protein